MPGKLLHFLPSRTPTSAWSTEMRNLYFLQGQESQGKGNVDEGLKNPPYIRRKIKGQGKAFLCFKPQKPHPFMPLAWRTEGFHKDSTEGPASSCPAFQLGWTLGCFFQQNLSFSLPLPLCPTWPQGRNRWLGAQDTNFAPLVSVDQAQYLNPLVPCFLSRGTRLPEGFLNWTCSLVCGPWHGWPSGAWLKDQ